MGETTVSSPYKAVFNALTATGGLLLRGEQSVIPQVLQQDIIALAQGGRLGETGTIRTLRDQVWFPSMGPLVKEYGAFHVKWDKK